MSFLTFLLYFIGAKLVYELLMLGAYYLYKKYINYRFKKAIESGKIKVVTMDELVEKKTEEDGTWH